MLQKSYHTKTSDLIVEFIASKIDSGFTAGELSAFLKERGFDVNKTTVYRNLDKMTEAGRLIKSKSVVSDGYVYQTAEEENHCDEHMHFRCCKCGSVIHLSDEKTKEYLDSISRDLGIEINVNISTLNGICSKCRKQK
ncbi:Fur family transcriptional regulator [Treponema sp.]|uniref:Fur family transcriptional regulator n=1 Tax=Treponema sp. TaxID=166 RepID=UPI0025CB9638|nr:transcriptional repressor [Treponema sp.]MCR5217435.1 transcriptional repressor [Treponema sp.]